MGDIQLSNLGLDTLTSSAPAGKPTSAALPPVSELGLTMAKSNAAPAPADGKPPVVELYPGMKGFFVPGRFTAKDNDSAKTPRQLFVQIGDDGNERGTYFFDPKGKFTNMLDDNNIGQFVADPDTFDARNPSGFEPSTFKVLQQYRGNPAGLRDYARRTGFGIWKQETAR